LSDGQQVLCLAQLAQCLGQIALGYMLIGRIAMSEKLGPVDVPRVLDGDRAQLM
jgi:hypothetical protein